MGVYADSNAASNRELSRNFPNPPLPEPVKKKIAGITDTVEASPLANAAKFVTRNVAAGITAVPAAFMDVSNKVANAANSFVGGDADYFSTDNTAKALSIAAPPQAAPAAPASPTLQSANSRPGVITDKPVAVAPTPQPISALPAITGPMYEEAKQKFVATEGAQPIAGASFSVSGNDPRGQVSGRNADGTLYDNKAALRGITDFSNQAKQQDLAEAAQAKGMVSDGRGGFRLMNQGEMDAAGLTTPDQMRGRLAQQLADANQALAYHLSSGNQYNGKELIQAAQAKVKGLETSIADITGVQTLAQKKADSQNTLDGQKYTADQTLAAHKARGITDIEVAKIGADGRVSAAVAAQTEKAATAKAAAEQKLKSDDEKRINQILGPREDLRPHLTAFLQGRQEQDANLSALFKSMNPSNANQYKSQYLQYMRLSPDEKIKRAGEFDTVITVIKGLGAKKGFDPFRVITPSPDLKAHLDKNSMQPIGEA